MGAFVPPFEQGDEVGLVLDMDQRCLDYFVNRRFKARIASQLPDGKLCFHVPRRDRMCSLCIECVLPDGALSFHVPRRALVPMHSLARAPGQTQTDIFVDSYCS